MRICFLEQGCGQFPKGRKGYLVSEQSDYYRLNWKVDDDPSANWTRKDVGEIVPRFTQGRGFLFEKVRGSYDYYIFIDEDIDLWTYPESSPEVLPNIMSFLEEYKPVAGHILTKNVWSWSPQKLKTMYELGKPLAVGSHDVCVFIYSNSLAELLFPLKYHGSGSALWYHQWLVTVIAPDRYLLCPNVFAINADRNPHYHEDDRGYKEHILGEYVSNTFSQWIKERHC